LGCFANSFNSVNNSGSRLAVLSSWVINFVMVILIYFDNWILSYFWVKTQLSPNSHTKWSSWLISLIISVDIAPNLIHSHLILFLLTERICSGSIVEFLLANSISKWKDIKEMGLLVMGINYPIIESIKSIITNDNTRSNLADFTPNCLAQVYSINLTSFNYFLIHHQRYLINLPLLDNSYLFLMFCKHFFSPRWSF
jgi:hypothetical protein